MSIRNIHPDVTLGRVLEAVQADDLIGICIECGDESSPWEPDARKCTCESCGKDGIFGVDEMLLCRMFHTQGKETK